MNNKQMKKHGIVEVFLPIIDDFPNYEVSNYGNVRNFKSGGILKLGKNKLDIFVWIYNITVRNRHKECIGL
jgi:hypothetical protein